MRNLREKYDFSTLLILLFVGLSVAFLAGAIIVQAGDLHEMKRGMQTGGLGFWLLVGFGVSAVMMISLMIRKGEQQTLEASRSLAAQAAARRSSPVAVTPRRPYGWEPVQTAKVGVPPQLDWQAPEFAYKRR